MTERRDALIVWGPVVVMMLLIFVFSAQPKSAPPAHRDGVYFSGVMPIFTGHTLDTLVKKAAHMAGYGLLGVLIMRGFLAQGTSAREAAYFAILLAVCYALTDELHQTFVPGRHSTVLDIGFDYVGAASACLLARRVVEA
jgi:VanZ family protein